MKRRLATAATSSLPALALALALALAVTSCGAVDQDADPSPTAPPGSTATSTADATPGADDALGSGADDAERAAEIEQARQREQELRDANAGVNAAPHAAWVLAETMIAPGSRDLYHQPAGAATRGIVDVRFGLHDGFDRLVIELDGEPEPGWFAWFSDAIWDDDGEPIEVIGEYVLALHILGIRRPGSGPDRAHLYSDVPVLGPVLRQARVRGWHDGNGGNVTLFLGIGLLPGDPQPAVAIRAVDGPSRIVIDVYH